jgi:hypothetical protein
VYVLDSSAALKWFILEAELECALVTADERLASLCGAVADIRLLGDLEGAGLAQ